jgi:probable O-glycosylation ligase (exosortase A-associated)
MSFRDLVLNLIVFAALPVAFARPWIGVLVWSWLGLMNPHRLTWGFSYTMPFALMVAVATLAGLVFTKDRRPLPRTRELYLLIALWALFVLSTLGALYPDDAWVQLDKVSKILLMTFVGLMLLQDEHKLRGLIWVIAMSVGFFGLKGGIWALRTGGTEQVLGPPDSFIEGNTEIGLALNMVLPLLIFLRREESRWWLRSLLTAMVAFSAVAIVFTYSRGAVVGLAVVLVMLVLKSRARFMVAVLLAVAILLGQSFAPPKWFGRMETMQTYEQDRSAMGRINAWYVAYRIALDHPLLGAGFRPFTIETHLRYLPSTPASGLDAHSIFFQVLGEHGFTGLALYVALIVSILLTLRSVMRSARGDPSGKKKWMESCAQMLEASLVAYVVSGLFLSQSYFDLFYYLVAITMILKVLVDRPTPQPAEVLTAGSAGHGLVGH